MTVKDLKEKLSEYDDNLEIELTVFGDEQGYSLASGYLKEEDLEFYITFDDKLGIDLDIRLLD